MQESRSTLRDIRDPSIVSRVTGKVSQDRSQTQNRSTVLDAHVCSGRDVATQSRSVRMGGQLRSAGSETSGRGRRFSSV